MKEILKAEIGIPLYYQLKEIMKEKIESGEWKTGDQIPNELVLADDYKVSRATVRQAILDLVRAGLLSRKQGKGTFVATPKAEGDFINFHLSRDLDGKHVPISVTEIACPHLVAKSLNLHGADTVFEVIRLRYFKDDLTALEKSYLPAGMFPDFLQNNFEGRLYDLLSERYGVTITKLKTFIEPVLLDHYEAGLLETDKNQPALKLTRLGATAQGIPVLLNQSVFRGDRCRLLFYSESQ